MEMRDNGEKDSNKRERKFHRKYRKRKPEGNTKKKKAGKRQRGIRKGEK
jgi:hypothetical protein